MSYLNFVLDRVKYDLKISLKIYDRINDWIVENGKLTNY